MLAVVEGDTVFEDGLELLVEDVLAVGVEGTGELWRRLEVLLGRLRLVGYIYQSHWEGEKRDGKESGKCFHTYQYSLRKCPKVGHEILTVLEV